MTLKLGCIADDFTGATDLADMLSQHGMRTILSIGLPRLPLPEAYDALVIALKSRTIAAAQAVEQSLAALAYLGGLGCKKFYFKYCSTFDSTAQGNIGPVTDALMDALAQSFTIACPAFPDNKRTLYKGYLFAGDAPLHESGMRHHPLTPMHDSNLVRVLQSQTHRRVGLVPIESVWSGVAGLRKQLRVLRDEGVEIALVDALQNEDLNIIGEACADLTLVTAGSGLAQGIARELSTHREHRSPSDASTFPLIPGSRAVLSASCSLATQAQVKAMKASGAPAFAIDPLQLAAGAPVVEQALNWADSRLGYQPILIYATADSETLRSIQGALGADKAGTLVEEAMGQLAVGLVERGVTQLIVAGGETSGAVVNALNVDALQIGPRIVPGVPWTSALGGPALNLALKSGNFGDEEFLLSAWSQLE